MEPLSPSLWRTCKMLAGLKRIELLRQIYETPGRNVRTLGTAVGIKRSDASQELRRIQSRGLLRSRRQGVPLVYRMETDPLVPSAAPLLKALQSTFSNRPAKQDPYICAMARGLASERRIAIAQMLLSAPQSPVALRIHLNCSAPALAKNVRTLILSGFVRRKNGMLHFRTPLHPVAQTLARMLPPSR